MRTRTSLKPGMVGSLEPVKNTLQRLGSWSAKEANRLSHSALNRMKDITSSPHFWLWPFV